MTDFLTKKQKLDILNKQIQNCESCFKKPKRVLLGYGNPESEIMFIGESPSLAGIAEGVCPFQKHSWPTFLKILEIFNKTPESAYTTNIIKCSIPTKEIGKYFCQSNLLQELNIIKPKIAIFLTSKINKHNLPRPIETIFIFHRHPMVVYYSGNEASYLSELSHKYELAKAQLLERTKSTHKTLDQFR
jgi:uracil-DNA glycosylase family 4